MSLRIYVDDCAYSRTLVALLRSAGHDVQTPSEAGISGMGDAVHFQHAITADRALLTKNPHDFESLHQSNSNHAGILAIYQDNDATRDMNYAEVARTITNLEAAGIGIRGGFHILNAWRY